MSTYSSIKLVWTHIKLGGEDLKYLAKPTEWNRKETKSRTICQVTRGSNDIRSNILGCLTCTGFRNRGTHYYGQWNQPCSSRWNFFSFYVRNLRCWFNIWRFRKLQFSYFDIYRILVFRQINKHKTLVTDSDNNRILKL